MGDDSTVEAHAELFCFDGSFNPRALGCWHWLQITTCR